ncbi:EAL domain-containing protein [Clostridium sp.]|uniref:EAL domain-containing protein n=1 Tax=Clostridium sp. TaxID=1506 RepID=UPI003D6CDE12
MLNVPIAVNLSVNQFLNKRIIEDIIKILKETGLNPKYLELEVTENIIMKETEYIIESLKQLKALGVEIAIDDFGTEYSSLNYIKQLPVDKIKIDISFVRGINIKHKDEAIIKVIISLAKNLGLKVIAEGVETKEQLDFLKEQMCDEIQGYYYYKPVQAHIIEELMGN